MELFCLTVVFIGVRRKKMNKLKLRKYIQKELLQKIRGEFSDKEVLLAAEKLASNLLKNTKKNLCVYKTLKRSFYESQVDEIIQYQAWEVLDDFYNTQSVNDEISFEKQKQLKELGVSLVA